MTDADVPRWATGPGPRPPMQLDHGNAEARDLLSNAKVRHNHQPVASPRGGRGHVKAGACKCGTITGLSRVCQRPFARLYPTWEYRGRTSSHDTATYSHMHVWDGRRGIQSCRQDSTMANARSWQGGGLTQVGRTGIRQDGGTARRPSSKKGFRQIPIQRRVSASAVRETPQPSIVRHRGDRLDPIWNPTCLHAST